MRRTNTERIANPSHTADGALDDRMPGQASRVASALTAAATLGLFFGAIEVLLLGVAKFGLGRFTHLNPQVVWLAPVFYACLFVVLTALLLIAARMSPRMPILPAVVALCTFIGTSGVLFLYVRLHRGAAMLVGAGVAVQAWHLAARHGDLIVPVIRRALPSLVLLVVAGFTGLNGTRLIRERVGEAALPPARDGAPNIVLIIWDTVRATSVSVFGYERATTPTLERLVEQGAVVFDHAIAPSPWTLPSHASMFTGRWPHETGADWAEPLSGEHPTIAGILQEHGYRTAGFIANRFYVGEESGLNRGFLHYDADPVFSLIDFFAATTVGREIVNDREWRLRLGMLQKPGRKYADDVNREFLEWLGDGSDRPFFVFLNLFDAHHPYLPPPPFDTLFGPLLPGRDPGMVEGRTFTPRELQAEIDAYDGGIAYQDRQLALLLEELERRGELENTIVIVTSDHGEEFGEHGVFTHGNSLYQPALHVPLLIWDASGRFIPREKPRERVSAWVSTRDIAATVLDLAGVEDVERVPGRSLARFWNGTTAANASPDTLLAEVSHASGHPAFYPVSKGDLISVFADPLKYIRNGDGREQLYDLRADPGELRDLRARAEHRDDVNRLRAFADRFAGSAR